MGDSVTVTARLWGTGNVNRLPDLKMPPVDHLKTYADEPVFETRAGAQGLSGSKTMKWALVPDAAGSFAVPSFTISYFDPETESYRTEKTQSLVLEVLPGETPAPVTTSQKKDAEQPSKPAKQEVKEIGHDILPVYTAISELRDDGWFSIKTVNPGRPLCWVILLGPLLVYGVVFLGLRLNRKSERAVYAQRAKKAARIFQRECRRGEMDADRMIIAVRDYINDRFQLSVGSLTPAEVPALLVEKGVQPHTAESLRNVLAELEGRIYTGGEATCGSASQRILES